MNSEEFVEAIKLYVRDAAVEDTIANLRNPPGRRVSPQERRCSDWFNSLPDEAARHVRDVIASAVHETVFGLLAVIDGARTIDRDNGHFELSYANDRQRLLLNDPNATGLHDLLNASN